ncbi:3'-5' exoribonuclease HELZ2 [Gastrophryne carolinensis]
MATFPGLIRPDLEPLLEHVELRLACSKCAKKVQCITYTLSPTSHQCGASLLLSRVRGKKDGDTTWREVRPRPSFRCPARYVICWHFSPTQGCTSHQQRCGFAWTNEEIHVWTFERTHNLERAHLLSLLGHGPAFRDASTWEDLRGEFGGSFQDICEQCFYQSPRRVTLTDLCQCHPRPVPLLAHIVIDDARKQCYAIRPLPHPRHVRLCAHSSRGLLCREENGHCPHAHSEVELAVWKAEEKYGLSRADLTGEPGENIGFYCRLCLVSAATQESFEAHCSSQEHGRMLAADSLPLWCHRQPPPSMKAFRLCESPSHCIYGEGCLKAHSHEELEEWIQRVKISRRNQQLLEEEGLQPYQSRLLTECQLSSQDAPVLSEEGDEIVGVKITCDRSLKFQSSQKPARTAWNFTINTKLPLLHVALLKLNLGAVFSLAAQGLPQSCHYAGGSYFQVKGSRKMQYKVEVCAECSVFGVFEQWLTLDFGIRPVLLQKIFVQVGHQEYVSVHPQGTPEQDGDWMGSSERWSPGKKLVVPCKERTQEEKKLLDLYKPPSMNPSYCGRTSERQTLTAQNYRKMIHMRLLQEEAATEDILSRLSLKADVTLTKTVTAPSGEMRFAPNAELYAEVPLTRPGLAQDSEEGYLLQRSVTTALVAPHPQQDDRVYEVHIEPSNNLESRVLLRFPERCCRELSLQEESPTKLEIQFQLERLMFCFYHEATDRLLDEALLIPDLSSCCVPASQDSITWGNTKQQQAISYIAGTTSGKQPAAPLIIYGPFGTGKTSTLAKAALQVIQQVGTRVLICTHNNSAADLYIGDHFHPYVINGHPEATPLRVKYIKSPLNRTSVTILPYCALSSDRSCFAVPDRAFLDQHRIIITTAVTARDLDVPRGYFTHILLDEAAQMTESEALIPLAFINHRTRVVVAGDHMQETPRFFHRTEVEEQTLLTRLFALYQSKDCQAAKKSRIIFHQNYRSVPAIISFMSRSFYVGRDGAIESCAVETMDPPLGSHALSLSHVQGNCSPEGNSWINPLEVLQVVEIVKNVLQRWPEKWGRKDERKICVVSYGSQVTLIRQELRKNRLKNINVSNYGNIIGQEFHVIILSTVRSIDSLPAYPPSSSTFSLDFFCDPRVLNTILTRARAQVFVVGDVVALCSFGSCSRIWRNYLRECVEVGSASPPDLNVEEIKQAACERRAWIQQQGEEDSGEDSDSWLTDLDINAEDAILQELLDNKDEACVTVSEDGMLEMIPKVSSKAELKKNKYTNFATNVLEQYLIKQPNMYKKCRLVKGGFDHGYAITLDESPFRSIDIKGRENCGMGFSGDQVVVQLFPELQPDTGKVVGILKAGEKSRCCVCYMDPHDLSIMIPIDRSITKIFCPSFKEKPGLTPIRKYKNGHITTVGFEKVTQDMRRTTLFLVQVVTWREGFYYPLGIVTRVLPPVVTLEQGLKLLDLEFGMENSHIYPKEASEEANKLSVSSLQIKDRVDCRKILTFTVDPPNAQDLDDAISVQDQGDHYEIGVHITDLAAVIAQGGDLDNEAQKRGVTFYCPLKEPVHMLPHKMCADLCSLKPHCDRLTISLFVLVNKQTDQMISGKFCRSIISSDHQLSYNEVNSVLQATRESPHSFDTLEGCLCIAEHFSKVHRNSRLEKAANYKQPDEDHLPGSRDAQRMIEELMIMYNSWVAEHLTNQEHTENLTPVRCQNAPSLEKIKGMRTKFKHLLPFSAYLSHHLLEESDLPSPSSEKKITMLASVWNQLQDADRDRDYSKITDLLSTDDLYPELCCAVREFRTQLGRSYFVRSGTPMATGHYSLQLSDYTWASSPLRRYIDIVVQRMIQVSLTENPAQATKLSPKVLDFLCFDFDLKVKRESFYEKRGHSLNLALSLQKEVQHKLAVVMTASAKGQSFKIAFPSNGDSLSNLVSLDYNHLQPAKQPEETQEGCSLTWKRRLYSYVHFKNEPLQSVARKDVITFNSQAWHEAARAVSQGCLKEALESLKFGQEKYNPMTFMVRSTCGHYMELTLDLQPGVSLPIQLCSVPERGLPSPSPQLCTVAPGIQLCLEHTSQPIACFSKLANRAPIKRYRNTNEYQSIWQPLSDMEAVESAVNEGGSILLVDVPIRWSRRDKSKQAAGLKGTFKLTPKLIQECDLTMDFQDCYLCVRKEGLKAVNSQDLFGLQSYTWVCHGLTECTNNVSQAQGGDVEFQIHQATMREVPEAVLESRGLFTVEIIPKQLPDIRKETAIMDLKKASELTKNIVLGKQVPDIELNKKFKTQTSFYIEELPPGLNNSQTEAVRKALTQPFTLIQGPPGTGKTVVGVHLVSWFHHINQSPAASESEEGGGGAGQPIIMYCGPSNKSVDVVGEKLLKVCNKLRPLRVYSEQMELSEFPYPGSSLRVTGFLREGKVNQNIRSITLHHLIRQPANPYSRSIREYDQRIQRGEEMSLEEVEKYKLLIRDARSVELKRHDVILCTCVASSSRMLTDLPVAQVIIDECGMCTEPETLVPLVSHKQAQSIVLIGDHRQLRPVVKNEVCKILKMDRSMFERYEERALLLDTQYRMHTEICAFPSNEFYEGRLRTSPFIRLRPSLFCHSNFRSCPIVFGEILGQEQRLVVTTEEGNTNSKANLEQAKEAVRLATLLTRQQVDQKDIAILTPYNAQVSEVSKLLQAYRLDDVTVSTIMKSQGHEWRYVIFSTVRSLSSEELDTRSTFSWRRRYLGFLADPNQINVGLTRAKEGLCILGNRRLLACTPLWKRLLQHYSQKGAIVPAAQIQVARNTHRQDH